jgi:hypothetical protein
VDKGSLALSPEGSVLIGPVRLQAGTPLALEVCRAAQIKGKPLIFILVGHLHCIFACTGPSTLHTLARHRRVRGLSQMRCSDVHCILMLVPSSILGTR